VKGNDFEDVILVDSTNVDTYAVVTNRGFDAKDDELQRVERNEDNFASPILENGWAKTGESSDAEFAMTITCKNIVLVSKDSGSPKFGKADVYVDGKLVRTSDPLVNGWNHCNPQIVLQEKESGEHKVRIVMHPGDEEKHFTILGFGVTL
jgi:hypothetical protein